MQENKQLEIAGYHLLIHLLEDRTWEIFESNGITDSDFSRQGLKILKWIRDYEQEYGELPNFEFAKLEFTNIEWPEKAPLNFAVKNLDKLKKSLDLTQALVDTQDYVKEKKPDEAIEFLSNRLTEIRKPRLKLIQSFKERSEIRVEEYRQRSIYGMKGIEPPWPTLKEWFNVWENGTLNVYSGISGTGKSWTCAYFSKYVAFDLNKKVLLITMENDKSSLDMRTAAIYYGIPFFDLRTGQIDLKAYNNWLDDTSLQSERGDVFIYDRGDVKNVLDIQSLIYKHQPDMTIIDAAYLLDHSGKKFSQGYDNQKELVEEMMDVARDTKIPWLATNQLNESVLSMEDKRNAGFKTRGSKSWHHSPATSINGFITPEDVLMGTISMAIGKNREGAGGAGEVFKIATDHQRMTFIEVEEYVDQEILDDLI